MSQDKATVLCKTLARIEAEGNLRRLHPVDALQLSELLNAWKREQASKTEPNTLTTMQTLVIAQLRDVAAATERHWRKGEPYYLDDRLGLKTPLRAAFNKVNPKPRKVGPTTPTTTPNPIEHDTNQHNL